MLIVDFETRSKANLSDLGGRLYAEHPTTEVLCACFWDPEDGRVDWVPGQGFPWHESAFRHVHVDGVLAHNANTFDRHIWRRLGWPEPPRWADSAEWARRAGYPSAKLEWLGENLLGRPKDMVGNKFTIGLSRVRPKDTKAGAKRGDYYTPVIDAATRARVVEYCWSDVELLRDLVPILSEWDDLGAENDVLDVDHVINDRGFCFDVDLARVLLDFDAFVGEAACDAAGVLASVVRAPVQFAKALAALGCPVPNAQKETIEPLTHHADPRVAALAKARLAISSICKGKLEAGLDRVSADGRLRDLVGYYGAHTGRWSGRALQPHNLPKPGKEDILPRVSELPPKPARALIEAAVEADIRALRAEDPHPALRSGHVPVLLRACITAPPGRTLLVADYSAVEARGLSWAARDEASLTGFRTPGYCPYRAIAGRLFGVADPSTIPKDDWRRQFGKQLELGLGYGMGWRKFHDNAAENGVDWALLKHEFKITPESAVGLWREVRWPVVDLWHDLQHAATEAVYGRASEVGPFQWARVDQDVWCLLPSGRPVVYHRMHAVKGKYGPELRYYGRKGVEYTYGGKLTENLVQAMCRDLLGHALVECERAGLCPVLHVHDEIICEVEAAQAEDGLGLLELIMTTPPDWAEGFPIGVEGFIAPRYRK